MGFRAKSLVAGLLFALMACAAQAQPAPAIATAPAFTAAELNTLPGANWITNGGSLANQRYSPLARINRANVKDLKAVWRFGMGSGMAPNHSGEAQILAYEGVLYVTNADSDVFAVGVETGKAIWTWRANQDLISGNPHGKASRGLALGDGKVFVATREAQMVALDQKTGKPVWSTQMEDWKTGFSVTSAPLYYNGLIITGFTGGDMGLRGRVKAYDARTGALRWTFFTIPGPGEVGFETWPKDNDAWKTGGGAVWQTPAVDPETGLLYFSVGNAGPDQRGTDRPGDNLFSASIVALEAATGKYRWHFQQVHHDLWDYDCPNPVVLFDAVVAGQPRKGLANVCKTGFTYILDRVTGKPLIGIEERPVPQEPRQATAATQPYPIGDAIVPQEILIPPEGARLEPGTTHLPNYGRIFTPFWTEPVTLKPGTRGGANWPPSAYDPTSNLLFVCATDRATTLNANAASEKVVPAENWTGGKVFQTDINDNGVLAAVDVRTNRLAWRQLWRESCFSGVVATGGGLIFVGRSDGRLTALDSSDGGKLWEFLTDAGVNSTVTTFEFKAKQYVVVHAGGNNLAGSKRGDGMWLFALDGKMGPVKPPRPAPPAGVHPATPGRAADAKAGAVLYKQGGCVSCHGEDGAGGHGGGKSLVTGQSADAIVTIATAGKYNMPAFASVLSQDQLYDIAAYVTQVLAKPKR